tara:strand:+ start:2791 stop:3753 length:963 start_codon:yes stop_codon:yes gene_type:complete
MKVLLCNRPGGAFGYISDGWANALRSKGHLVERWDGQPDSWTNFGPDLYVGCSGHKQPILKDRGDCKVAVHVNPYGPTSIPGINENMGNIEWTVAHKPDVVFGYGHERDRLLWSYWKQNYGIQWVPMPCAADTTIFKPTTKHQDKDLDIVYLGGRWSYKGQTIDRFLLPALSKAKNDEGMSYSVRGWGEWPSGICEGILPEDQSCQFLNRGRIAPCISEQHTQQFGIDVPERAFKVALCGALIIHDPVISVRSFIESAIISANAGNFYDLIRHYHHNEEERQELVKKQQEEILLAHTYHHRVAGLLDSVGYKTEAEAMIN